MVTSGGARFPGHSGVLGAVINDSSELNMVIGVAGDVDHDCWRYENSKGGTGSDVSQT